MVLLWFYYGFSMALVWFYQGFTMVLLWFYYGFTMVLPWWSSNRPSATFPRLAPNLGSQLLQHLKAPEAAVHGHAATERNVREGVEIAEGTGLIQDLHQWPFQDPRLEVPTIYKAYVRPKYGLIWYSTSILGSWNSHWLQGDPSWKNWFLDFLNDRMICKWCFKWWD